MEGGIKPKISVQWDLQTLLRALTFKGTTVVQFGVVPSTFRSACEMDDLKTNGFSFLNSG